MRTLGRRGEGNTRAVALAHAPGADLWSPSSPLRRRAVQYGALVISLDFELLWGVRDKRTIADYGPNILGVRKAVPALLDLFAQREIACTWATVGLLFFATNKALRAGLPARKPRYSDARISSYHHLNEAGSDEARDPYHYGLCLIRPIAYRRRQEL